MDISQSEFLRNSRRETSPNRHRATSALGQGPSSPSFPKLLVTVVAKTYPCDSSFSVTLERQATRAAGGIEEGCCVLRQQLSYFADAVPREQALSLAEYGGDNLVL